MMNEHHVIDGMQGIGDCIRQRAIVEERCITNRTVWLRTPWPQLFQDMVANPFGAELKLLPILGALRTQAKNVIAYSNLFTTDSPPPDATTEVVWYTHKRIRETGSFLRATMHNAGLPLDRRNYTLPLPQTSFGPRVESVMERAQGKPICLFRPLVTRKEWGGCGARNPDAQSYYELYQSIRDRYFVVAVADVDVHNETFTYPGCRGGDTDYLHGELSLNEIIAITSISSLVFASPGFACILASALHTPSVMVCGGHEHSGFYAPDMLAPFLGIDPIAPDDCFTHECGHDKTIDMPRAMDRLQEFVTIYA